MSLLEVAEGRDRVPSELILLGLLCPIPGEEVGIPVGVLWLRIARFQQLLFAGRSSVSRHSESNSGLDPGI